MSVMHSRFRMARPLLLATWCAAALFAIGCSDVESRRASVLDGETVRLLIVGDPFSFALRSLADELGRRAGGTLAIEVASYDELRALTLRNALDYTSSYDIISFDIVWVGEYGSRGMLLPLDAHIAASPILEPGDFLPIAYQGSAYQNLQLGLPIQPHPELLWLRADRFALVGLKPPETTDELLAAAAKLTWPERGEYGICWNGQRGVPLGQQMAHFYAAFGQPLLGSDGRPTLNTPRALEAARFAVDLLPYSPPDVLSMAWDQRTNRFVQGGCAMTYEWVARTYLAEADALSAVRGKVRYLAPPHAYNAPSVTPMGAWSLGIPANIGERKELAWAFLEWLSSPAMQRLLAEHGNGGMPRRSLLSDPDLVAHYPAFTTVAALDARDELQDWMRPPIPEWSGLEYILGTVFHDMLRGEITPELAVARAQLQAERLFAGQPPVLPSFEPSQNHTGQP